MSIIEGIGDEVTHFFLAISVILIVTIAWMTTDIRQQWNIRTVYLLDRRRNWRNRSHRLTNHTESATISEGRDPVENTSTTEEIPPGEAEPGQSSKPPGSEERDESGSDSREDSPQPSSEEEEQNIIMGTMDGNMIRQRRLAFFQNERLLLGDLIDDQAYDRQPETSTQTETPTQTVNESAENQSDSNITIKLKYINDDLKVVDGRLEELLGDFKRRHFEVELSSNKLVKLIFQGQVLQRDTDTLQSYGMYNNCVVHCLVRQKTSTGEGGRADGGDSSGRNNGNNNNNNQRDWDLGNLLIATVSFCLGSAWYFRYQYPQLFTVTATVGLVAITGIFTVISIGMYFPDNDRQQPQPQQQDHQRPQTENVH